MDSCLNLLHQYFGFEDFRGIQREIIDSIMAGQDTLGLMPTGGGKSITFQIPALASEGICIVITPLIALMKDQVEHLRNKGIKAAAIYMGMTHDKVVTTLDNCVLGDYKLLYISPERISSELFQKKLLHMHVSFICVDEAHCISQWGYDFRPSYLDIKQLRKLVPHAHVLALTATATPRTVTDIQQQLGFPEEHVFRMSFERRNLAYKVYKVTDKMDALKRILSEREGSTIIYCRNRQRCKELAEELQQWGYTATFYHAGLSNTEKDERQHKWQADKLRIMVATNAFGMGIDKAEVRLVVHMGLPDSIESYFQEAGRAGRDGQPSEAILLYDSNDTKTLKKRVDEVYPSRELIRDIYEQVSCYLQIAIGFGQGHRREFNLADFCRKFHHFPTIVESALALLTKAGYIQYSDADEPVSRLMFEVRRDDLYYIQANDPEKAQVIQALLRHYTGLFVNYAAIDENLLSKHTGLNTERIYHILRALTQQHILSYIPKKSIPHIIFTRRREEKEYITIPRAIYEVRRTILQEQIDSMLEYVTSDNYCRNRYLLEYFGETVSKRKGNDYCGQCDVCIERANTPSLAETIKSKLAGLCTIQTNESDIARQEDKKQLKESILQQLRDKGKLHPFTINTGNADPNVIKEAMNELVDEERIRLDENLWICLA